MVTSPNFLKGDLKMKLKNVLKGLRNKFDIEEIHILTASSVVFSGTVEKWDNTEQELLEYKYKLENADVVNRMMFNGRKAFIFI